MNRYKEGLGYIFIVSVWVRVGGKLGDVVSVGNWEGCSSEL